MDANRLPLIAVLSVVFVSGCLGFGGGTADTGAGNFGVVSTAFEADVANLFGEDRFTLFLEVENTGGADAEDVVAFLHGIPIGSGSDTFALDDDNPQLVSRTLQSPDDGAGIPGDVDEVSWDMTTPDLPEGITRSYQPRARLLYGYTTTATSTVTALTADENRRLRASGETVPTQTQTVVTEGPLGVTINARTPAIIRDDDDRLRLVIDVQVLQSGSVFDPDYDGYEDTGEVPEEQLDEIAIELFAPGTSATSSECESLGNEVKERLRAGSSMTFSCELKVEDFSVREDIPIRVEMDYNFLTDVSTSITVEGTREGERRTGTSSSDDDEFGTV